jgi:hypothetical protein
MRELLTSVPRTFSHASEMEFQFTATFGEFRPTSADIPRYPSQLGWHCEVPMKKERVVVLRVTQEMFDELREQRVLTGCNTNEYIRRAIRMALFADKQATK